MGLQLDAADAVAAAPFDGVDFAGSRDYDGYSKVAERWRAPLYFYIGSVPSSYGIYEPQNLEDKQNLEKDEGEERNDCMSKDFRFGSVSS